MAIEEPWAATKGTWSSQRASKPPITQSGHGRWLFMAEKSITLFPARAPCQAAGSVYVFTHVPHQEASLRSWKARKGHQLFEILKADPLFPDFLLVRMTHSKPEVSWDQLSQFLNGRSSPCLFMNWKCLCLLEPAQGSPNTVPVSLKETGSYYWIAPRDRRHSGRPSCSLELCLFDGKFSSPLSKQVKWCLQCNEEHEEDFIAHSFIKFQLTYQPMGHVGFIFYLDM